MDNQLQINDPENLFLTSPVPLSLHPAAVYLDSLAPGSKPTMKQSLDAIASLLTGGECDAMTLDWSKLRYQHTSAVRTALKKRLSPTRHASSNRAENHAKSLD